MTRPDDPLIELRTRLTEVSDLERLGLLLAWDQEIVMPPAGAEWRASQRATLERLTHERFTDDRIGELLEAATPATPLDEDLIRVTRRDYDKARRVPAELVADLVHAAATAREAWARAREDSDFALLEPHLRRNVELRRRYVACFPEARRPYDALLDDYEPGMRTGEVEDVLGRLRDGLVPLVAAAGDGVGDDAIVRGGPFPADAQRRLVEAVLRQAGVDDQRWRLDVALHPFQATISPGDLRLTTRYVEDDLDSLFGTLHEFGHGLYEANIDPELARSPLAGGASSAVHESQSRLWENMVGRSAGFWRWCFPHLQAAFPERFAGRSWPEVHRAVNAVKPTLIRVSADEVTYGLHVVLRFELELALFEGDLAVADLPAAWRERMRAYLGLEVPDDAHGVLQDIHWAEGLFGYFPTYALGNVIAGQLWARITADLPDLDERLARGDFTTLTAWLAEHVHRHGRRLEPQELVARAAGGPLDPRPYLEYVRAKVAGASARLIA
ncbi:MAG TPA: carboxypeptidase M32 [Solirubrobacteraceae bacterium]|nr:carboxypeptidase M32 [Solirubrobacteraceae bacterium]